MELELKNSARLLKNVAESKARGVLPYSLGGGVQLCSQKSCPLLDY